MNSEATDSEAGTTDRTGSSSERALKTLLVSDLVSSTRLVEGLGDARAAELFRRHDRIARDLLREHDGLEIDKTDGFLMLFERPLDAVLYALAYHRGLRELSASEGVELASRVGVHLGEVYLRENPPEDVARGAKPLEVEGLAKPIAARLMSVAVGGQTLLTQGAFDLARRAAVGEVAERNLTWLAHGRYLLKGVDEPVEVYEVGVEGVSPLAPPPDSAKVKRLVGDESILGWRPAGGQAIPGRSNWVVERKLGEGGFGEVWLCRHEKTGEARVFKFCFEAERLRALKREVTLFRLLKEALGEREDIARIVDWSFDQAPYYIESEYTAGGSLSDWAEEQGGLGAIPRDVRVELVAQVAEALGAAHSVGVLHKDVKPQNVLVSTDREGNPRAILTDFGIGLITDTGRLVSSGITVMGMTQTAEAKDLASSSGTPLYMAPELLEGRPATVQADVYALGVLLYQMAVGDLGHALAPGWERGIDDELLVEEIGGCVDGDPSRRESDARKVAERLRTLEQRRAERAEERRKRAQAEQAVAALERHRRRRKVVAVAVGALTLFAGAMGVLSYRVKQQAERADREAEAAKQVSEFLVGLFAVSDPSEARGNTITAREILDRGVERIDKELTGQPLIQVRMMSTMGDVYHSLGLYEKATPLLEGALRLRREHMPGDSVGLADSLDSLAALLQAKGDDAAAEALFREALAMLRRLHGDEHPLVAQSLSNLANLLHAKGDYAAAEPLLREALAMQRRLLGDEHPQVATGLNNLAGFLQDKGDYGAAEPLFREALAMWRRLLGDEHPQVATGLNNLANLLYAKGDLAAAEPLLREALAMRRRLFGDEHPHVALSLNNLGLVLRRKGDYAAAEPLFREALAMNRRLLGDEHPSLAKNLINLARLLREKGDYDAAEPLLREALAMQRRLLGDEHPDVTLSLSNLAALLHAKGDDAAAEPLYREALAIQEKSLPPDHPNLRKTVGSYAALLRAMHRDAEAAALETRLAAAQPTPQAGQGGGG